MSKKIFTLIAMGAALNALAQKDTSRATNLDEVVITATKFPIKTSATGKVVAIVTKEQLEQSGGKDLAQILTEQTGLYISGANSSAGSIKSVFLQGAAAEHTLITIDGVPVYDPSGVKGNFDIRNLSVDLVERIEILKGSQSTLYGSDAIAGVINIITKKSTSNKPVAVNGAATYGSNNTFKGNVGLLGKTNGIDYNVGYSYHKTDGINDAASTAANADKDGYKQEAFSANFSFKAAKNFTVKPYLRYTYVKSSIDQSAFKDELDYTYFQKSFQTGVKNELTFGKTRLNVLYSFNKIERSYTDDSTLSQNGFAKFVQQQYAGTEHFADAYANFELCKSTKLTVGADYRSSKASQDLLSISSFGPYTASLAGDSIKQNQVGVYAALNYADATGFNIEVGGRYNNHSIYGSNGVFNINPSYQITDDIKVFANISSGYRTPSLYQLYDNSYGNKSLKPEVAYTTQIGLQHYFVDKKIMTQVLLFSRRINDVHYIDLNTYPTNYINQDVQKDFGLEFEASFKIAKNTTLKTFASFIDGSIYTKNDNGKDTSYNNFIRRPRQSAGISLSTQITKRLFVSINANWFGKRTDIYPYPKTTTQDSYALLDAYAEYSFLKNKLKVFANARNITNTNFTEVVGYNTLGFNAYGGVRFNF